MQRKTAFILCFVILLIRLPVYSANFMTGVRLGLNLATWYGEDVNDRYKELLPGFMAGVALQTKALDFLAVEMDVLYSQKGAKWESGDMMVYDRQHYIDVPVFAKFILPNPSIAKPFAYAGSFLAFTFLSKEIFVYKGEVEDVANISEHLSRVDFGFVFGSGVDLELGKFAITFDVRYGLGITSVDDDREAMIKNGVLSFIFGLSWAP